jgi:hypothetical protein
MDPAEALRIAREGTPLPAEAVEGRDPADPAPGTRVAVLPDDYGFDPVEGEVVFAGRQEIAVRRRDADLGEVVVHFPRAGFRVVV